ncbi:MAG: 3'(2'),5'-bisphosphate nucleotidase CysQ [Pseudohongiellaceae bacterium]|nr:3'(2'),5'-bisphosphate nucleotidase CysQ [Pseudohongiellaceae bacterium]
MTDLKTLLDSVQQIAIDAGEKIMEVYERDGSIDVQSKGDDSPLTEADTKANALITKQLRSLTPDIPIMSEEEAITPYETRRQWQEYWLVDPLDGTKEFINRNGEFTVNIALIRAGQPVLGVVFAPVLQLSWLGVAGEGAWKQEGAASRQAIGVAKMGADKIRVVASRRHGGEALEEMLLRLKDLFKEVELVNMGSSLKICILAEGKADLYPRLAPTSEWDTAAAQAVLAAAGGEVTRTNLEALRYNTKESVLNPFFLALGDTAYDWRNALGELPE